MEKKILFLDFDGVLFDTLKEVYLINRYIYKGIDLFDKVDEANYELFSKYKYLVYNIWMFYYYNPLIFNNCENIIDDFINALSKRNIKAEEDFCDNFLKVRANLVKNNYDFWKNLETPYEFFYEIKKLYEEKNPKILIVSKKNKTSIIERFNSYNFNISNDDIYAREILDKYSTKGEFINEYMNKNGFDEAIFVDDNNNNLKTCDNYSNITQILALWGNSQPNLKGYNQTQAIDKINQFFS